MSRKPNKNSFLFHPREVAISGYSGSGKTTLIKSLMSYWKNYRVAYFKHDHRGFQMDYPGKDTFEVFAGGAQQVFLENDKQGALIRQGSFGIFQKRSLAWDYDFVVMEGYKHSPAPKLLMLDAGGLGLKALQEGRISSVLAVVGDSPRDAPQQLPFFHRDDIPKIAAFMEVQYLAAHPIPELRGLVLSGGFSRRMGRDKALLDYHGRPQGVYAYEQLKELLPEVYLSCRAGQWRGTPLDAYPQIHDSTPISGPMGGILSGMSLIPTSAWLVVACDLPYLKLETLKNLLARRNPFRLATHFLSLEDQLPEPLCAIYEDRIQSRLWEAYGHGFNCPRKVLIHSNCQILELEQEENPLANINYWQDYVKLKPEAHI